MDGARETHALQLAAVTADEETLDRACGQFHRDTPQRSAKRVLFWTQAFALAALGYGLYLALKNNAALTGQIALWVAYALFAIATAWRLYAAANLQPVLSRIGEPRSGIWPTYTLLCPLYHEANVVFDLVTALERLNYPREALEIKLLVEGDDVETLAAALGAASAANVDVVIIPPAAPRTKPKALNVGLSLARGEFVCVYDAEDRPHPLQLQAAVLAFEDGGANLACVQAPLVVDNASASWIARQFAAEYAIQFRETLPMLARLGLPLPLGGSTNHFRIEALRAVGAWDPYNVTEDIDLGYRFARQGWKSGVIAPPTWEEAPITFSAWLTQRTRWVKGHLHTWLVLMRNPFRTAHEMGAKAFWSMQLVLGGGVAASFLHGPLAALVLWALLSPTNTLGVLGFTLALGGYCVGVFAALSASALSGDLSHARAAPTMPLYWPLSTIAAVRALCELAIRPHHWAKTTHGVSARARFPFESGARASSQATPDLARRA